MSTKIAHSMLVIGELGKVLKGWHEGILGMKKGGKHVIVIPSELVYGKAGSPSIIPPNTNLIFEIEVRPRKRMLLLKYTKPVVPHQQPELKVESTKPKEVEVARGSRSIHWMRQRKMKKSTQSPTLGTGSPGCGERIQTRIKSI